MIYPILIYVLGSHNWFKAVKKSKYFPSICIICAAYNEEQHIERKIQSFISLNYPKDKIKLIIISDCSTDGTNEIVGKYSKEYKNIRLKIQSTRQGKPAAQNLVEPEIDSEIVILSDAASMLEKNSIIRLINYFKNDDIGLVSAKLEYRDESGQSVESLYWKFETFLRMQESKFFSIIGASGALFALRREYFTQIDSSSPDDFERVLIVLEKKRRAIYVADAVVYDYLVSKSSQEITRKIRMISREWFVLMRHLKLINPFKYLRASFILFSHKIIRWVLPIFSLMILVSSIVLSFEHPMFIVITSFQLLIYLMGNIGLLLEKKFHLPIFLRIPTYYLGMNYASLIGLLKFLLNKKETTWDTIR